MIPTPSLCLLLRGWKAVLSPGGEPEVSCRVMLEEVITVGAAIWAVADEEGVVEVEEAGAEAVDGSKTLARFCAL